MKFEIKIKEFTRDDLIETLFEGLCVISYWADYSFEANKDVKIKKEIEHQVLSPLENALNWYNEEGTLKIIDIEANEVYNLSALMVYNGIEKALNLGYLTVNQDVWDADSYDAIIQCAIFGDVLYC